MKKGFVFAAALALVCTSLTWVYAGSKPAKPEKGIIIGQAVEFSTYATIDPADEKYVDALMNRAEQGFPVGIIEEDTDDLWLLVYRNPAPASGLQTANAMLTPLMGKKVVAQGLKYERNGVRVLRMSIVSEY